ncbi:MAG: flagellar export chaperone FliS [Gammaproteobacteria bacterium]|nr:flagellar export chaperone FliS [Gammaproteobacteria bacterium]
MLSANPDAAIRQYKRIATESRIDDATPHRLIQLMMERALEKIALARTQMQEGEIQEKGNNITDAIGIINGLQASLNHEADKRMSENFDALYAYMMRRLLEANLHNDDGKLEEVAGLLRELKEAWDAIADIANDTKGA